ncbi:unnamed protein product, partial [Laminaria digitata]
LAKIARQWEAIQRDSPNDGGDDEEPIPEPVPSPPIQIAPEPPFDAGTADTMKPRARCLPEATSETDIYHFARRGLDRSCRSPTHTTPPPQRADVSRTPPAQQLGGGAGSVANEVDGDSGSASESSLERTKNGDNATDTKLVREEVSTVGGSF